jgi:pre-mRNA-splicing helicase BRR2
LPENLNAEIDSGRIESIPDAIDWLAWSFLYRRIAKNPNYYGIAGKTAQHINDYLSELAEDSLSSLT